jgi:hypothetical protein
LAQEAENCRYRYLITTCDSDFGGPLQLAVFLFADHVAVRWSLLALRDRCPCPDFCVRFRGVAEMAAHRDALAPQIAALRKVHSITSSAMAGIVGGTLRPSVFAEFEVDLLTRI